jgi:hypothetical protein
MPNYDITSAITIAEKNKPNSQVTIDEPIWHVALRVVKCFRVTEKNNRITTIGFIKGCYPEMDLRTARIVVDAAIYEINNAIYISEDL